MVGDDYTLLNASIGLSGADANWDVIVWGKNLADEDYLLSGARNRDATQPTVPGATGDRPVPSP